jgi:hypothetical protein
LLSARAIALNHLAVQQVHSLRIQVQLHVAHVFAAVGEKLDLLVGLHALELEQLKKAALGFSS